ncbi:MAG: sigma-70 family RNA polymerase sigma factor [Gammaproteobacteria bacterium]|nr:sigma-70 family RNA polymerase sigma factor [Gammaproteobacteria bacterium]
MQSEDRDRTDRCLVNRFLAGDQTSFDQLVLRYQDSLHRFFCRSTDVDAADDLAQDAFLEVYRSLATWRGQSSFRTWLFGVARNVGGRHLRRRLESHRADEVETPVDGIADTGRGPLQSLDDGDQNAALLNAVARLPWEQRVAIVLRAMGGMSYDQIAIITGAPKGTVRSRLHSARQALARVIREELP